MSVHSASANESPAIPPTTAKRRSNIPSLVAALSASLTTGGTTYAFGLYGNDLKKSLSLTAGELDTISTAFFVAGLFSWIPGLSADRFGTRFSIATGGISGATALLTYWAVAKQFLLLEHHLLVPVLSVLGIVIFLSNAMITGSVFKIIVTCCGAGTKGSAVGVAKGFVGLGSGVYACIFSSIRLPNQSNLDFLPMAAFFACFSATLPALLLLPTKAEVDRDIICDTASPRHFHILFSSLFVLAGLVVWNSLAELSSHHADNGPASERRHWPMAFLLVTVWLAPIASLFFLQKRGFSHEQQHHEAEATAAAAEEDGEEGGSIHSEAEEFVEHRAGGLGSRHGSPISKKSRCDISLPYRGLPADPPGINDAGMPESDDGSACDDSQEDRSLLQIHSAVESLNGSLSIAPTERHAEEIVEEENLNLVEVLRTRSAWFMLWTTTILVGAGTVETNNMGVMVESLGFPVVVTSSSLALFSVAQAAGRVATGAVSECALNWTTKRFYIDYGIPRPFFLVVASCVAALAHLVLAFATNKFFFVLGSMLTGAAFGMVWPLMVLIVGEIFGTANAGANYLFYDGFSSAIGTLLLTKLLAEHVYEKYVDVKTNSCYGIHCFQATHLVVTVLSLTCAGTSYGLLYYSRHTYNKRGFHRR